MFKIRNRAVGIKRASVLLLGAFSMFIVMRIIPWPNWLPVPAKYADADIYIMAGRALVAGVLPDSVNQEHPPLAKYLIGFFSVYLKNAYASAFVFGLLTAILAFLIASKLTRNLEWRALTVWIVAVDQVNVSLSVRPMLDIFMVFFGILGILFLLNATHSVFKYFIAGLSFGLALACKWNAIFFVIPALILLAYEHELKKGLAFLGPLVTGYVASYSLLLFKKGLTGFLSLQFWMLNFVYGRHIQDASVDLTMRLFTPLIVHTSTLAPVTSYLGCPPTVLGLPFSTIAQTVNAPLLLVPFPVLFWLLKHRTCRDHERQRTVRLLMLAIISFLIYEMVFPTMIGVWYFAPTGTLMAITAPAMLADFQRRGKFSPYLIYIYLAVLSTWMIFANAIYMACGVS